MNLCAPSYLKKITDIVKVTNNSIFFSVKCTCGNEKFIVFSNVKLQKSEEKYKKYNEFLRDPITGKVYWIRRNIFGKIVDKIEQDEVFPVDCIDVVKIKCATCGCEYIVFDNRKHGYDGVFSSNNEIIDNGMLFEQKIVYSSMEPVDLRIKLYYSETYEEFVGNIDEKCTFDDYKMAFTSIDVIAIKNNKKTKVFSFETA